MEIITSVVTIRNTSSTQNGREIKDKNQKISCNPDMTMDVEPVFDKALPSLGHKQLYVQINPGWRLSVWPSPSNYFVDYHRYALSARFVVYSTIQHLRAFP